MTSKEDYEDLKEYLETKFAALPCMNHVKKLAALETGQKNAGSMIDRLWYMIHAVLIAILVAILSSCAASRIMKNVPRVLTPVILEKTSESKITGMLACGVFCLLLLFAAIDGPKEVKSQIFLYSLATISFAVF